MNLAYNIFLIYEDLSEIVDIIEKSIKLEIEKRFNKLHNAFFEESFNIIHNEIKEEDSKGNCITLYFGSEKALKSEKCNALIEKALEKSIFIIPIIKNQKHFYKIIPLRLQLINAFEWHDESSKTEIVLKVLENLGLSEKDRRIFISYRRIDGLGMADQLLNILTRQGFNVFLDKYDVDVGKDFQKEIYNAIDDKAFLLVIESPKAYESEWIPKEINYALKTHMTVMILRWDNTSIPIEDTKNLRRIDLQEEDLYFDRYYLLKEDILNDLIFKIESEHSYGLLRRRNILIKSIEKEWKEYYNKFIYLNNWILYFKDSRNEESNKIITITPRIPKTYDLYILDNVSEGIKEQVEEIEKILFHQAYSMNFEEQNLIEWTIKEKLNIHVFRYIA